MKFILFTTISLVIFASCNTASKQQVIDKKTEIVTKPEAKQPESNNIDRWLGSYHVHLNKRGDKYGLDCRLFVGKDSIILTKKEHETDSQLLLKVKENTADSLLLDFGMDLKEDANSINPSPYVILYKKTNLYYLRGLKCPETTTICSNFGYKLEKSNK